MMTTETTVATPRARRTPAWGLWAGLFASGVVHVIMALRDHIVWGDEPVYLWLGQNLIHGRGYQLFGFPDVHHSPGYPVLTGLLSLITVDAAVASLIVYAICGTLLVLPVYGLAREMYGARVANWAAVIIGLMPALNVAIPVWGSLTEPSYLLLVFGALYTAWRALNGGPRWHHVLAGVCLGLAYLIRPEAVWYVIILFIVLAVLPLVQKPRTWAWLIGPMLLCTGFFVSFAPYAVFTRLQTGEWMVSEKIEVTFGHAAFLAKNDGLGADRFLWGLDSTGERVYFYSSESYNLDSSESILNTPQAFIKHVARNVRTLSNKLFSLQLLPAFLAPLVALGLFSVTWDRTRLRVEVFLFAMLIPPLTFLIFFVLERYYIPILIPLSIWAARGLDDLGDWLLETWQELRSRVVPVSGERATRIVLALFLAVVLLAVSPRALVEASRVRSFRPEHKAIGLTLREITFSDSRIMARYPAIPYHAKRQWVPSPHAELDEIIKYARAQNVNFWVVDSWEKDWRPSLIPLFNGIVPNDFTLVYTLDTPTGPILVFRLQPLTGSG